VKYGAAQRVEKSHNEDPLFMALRMDYCYVCLSHRTSEAVFRLREDSLPFAFEQQFKPNHKVLKPFSVVNVSGPQIFQAVRRAEELSLRLAFR